MNRACIRVPVLQWVPPNRSPGDLVAPGWLLFLRPFATREEAERVACEEGGAAWPSGPPHEMGRVWAVVVPAPTPTPTPSPPRGMLF